MAIETTTAGSTEVAVRRGLLGSTSAWFARTFESLNDRNLRILWIGTLFNFAGVTMNGPVQNVVAFDLFGNNKAVGTVALGSGMAMLLIAPLGGALADRVSKRSMLITCQGIAATTFIFVGFSIAFHFINIYILVASAFIGGTMFAMIRSVRNAYIGELATPEQRSNAVAVQQLGMTIFQVSGPFLAGILISWALVGSSGTYMLMGSFFVFGIYTMFQLPRTSAPTRTREPLREGQRRQSGLEDFVRGLLSDVWTGMKYAYGHPEIRWALLGFILLTIFGNPYNVLLPGYVKSDLAVVHWKSWIGILLGISAVGGFVISLFAAGMTESRHAPRILAFCNLTFGAALIGLWMAPNIAAASVAMFFVGVGTSGFQVLNLGVALKAAEVQYMGRVASLTMMAMSLSSVVARPIGTWADRYGEAEMFLIMGVSVIVVTLILIIGRARSSSSAVAA